MTAPATVKTPIGEYPVELDGYDLLVMIPPRACAGCQMPLASPLGLAWTRVFVQACYLYCCSCCPHRDDSPCPKELNERKWTQQKEVRTDAR